MCIYVYWGDQFHLTFDAFKERFYGSLNYRTKEEHFADCQLTLTHSSFSQAGTELWSMTDIHWMYICDIYRDFKTQKENFNIASTISHIPMLSAKCLLCQFCHTCTSTVIFDDKQWYHMYTFCHGQSCIYTYFFHVCMNRLDIY